MDMISPTMRSEMNALICGFEPFGGRSINNAWEVAQQLEGMRNVDVIKIPVSFEKSHQVIIERLNHKCYDLVLIMGETGFTTDYVRLERVAINYKDSLGADNDGVTADDAELIVDAPKAYFTELPVKRIAQYLKDWGHKVKVTNSTGTFVCNSVYYHILHYLKENDIPTKALFVHLPATTEVVSLEEMTETLEALIEKLNLILN